MLLGGRKHNSAVLRSPVYCLSEKNILVPRLSQAFFASIYNIYDKIPGSNQAVKCVFLSVSIIIIFPLDIF